jgi:hypothetical protein
LCTPLNIDVVDHVASVDVAADGARAAVTRNIVAQPGETREEPAPRDDDCP